MIEERRFHFVSRGRLLPAVIFSICGVLLAAPATGAPDYKLIPKLQELKDRPAAPEFTLSDANNKKVSLKDYRGKVVFLAFWATWCEFCREELPAMERLYRDYKDQGLEIVAVNIKDKREDALAFVRKNKLSFLIAMDPEGEIGLLYGAYATPTVYLIDRNGIVLARMWGPAGWYSPAARKLIGEIVQMK